MTREVVWNNLKRPVAAQIMALITFWKRKITKTTYIGYLKVYLAIITTVTL